MIAGSVAGMVEHAAVFPIDTIKTHVQAASAEEMAAHGTLGTARNVVQRHGAGILIRGLSALMPAIGPAHALMFSSYEQVLWLGGSKEPAASAERVAVVGALAGVVSTVLHDSCMVLPCAGHQLMVTPSSLVLSPRSGLILTIIIGACGDNKATTPTWLLP